MVVAYRLGRLTGWLLRRFAVMKAPYFSQPNLLAGRAIVPEFFQEQVTPESLGGALLAQLDDRHGRQALVQQFTDIHLRLRRNASARAAEAILNLLRAQPMAGRA
jgi:lipid-A-disaccharide synthase